MYNDYFGLRESPFSIAPDPRYLFMSDRHREALAHLLYGIRNDGGFVLLTGEIGTGKTTVCRCLLEQLPADTRVACLINPRLSALELLATICDEFGLPAPEGKSSKTYIDLLNAFLLAAHAAGRQSVLIIDEAQNLSADVLEQIRLLTNLETNRRKLLQIILLGQPELRNLLDRPDLRQLAQRITARYHLQALSKQEIASYVRHRLTVAGAHRSLFPLRLMPLLFRLSGGIPRRINILCDRALMGAYVLGKDEVDRRILVRAAREIWSRQPARRRLPLAAAALVAGVVLAFASTEREKPPASTFSLQETPAVQISSHHPPEQVFAGNREEAYRALLSAWGIDYRPAEDGDPCRHAAGSGLACLTGSGSIGSLRLLNRPAVLTVIDDRGGKAHAALIGLNADTARFLRGGEILSLPYRELERRWLGEYTILWRRPPFEGVIRPGDRGPQVLWLAHQLATLEGHQNNRSGDVLQGELLAGLKEFQRERGLEADGVVGPATLIHLESSLGGRSPQLLATAEGK